MDFRTYMIFTKPLSFLIQLMPNIGTKRKDGKKNMEKIQGDRKKKAYISGYRIIKEEKQTDKRNRLQKAGTEGRDNFPAPIYPKKLSIQKLIYLRIYC